MDNETVIDFLPCAFLYILSHLKWAHVDSGVLKQGILKTEFCFSELYKSKLQLGPTCITMNFKMAPIQSGMTITKGGLVA